MPDIAGVLERDRSDCRNCSLPHRPVAARLLVDPLLADQEQEEDAILKRNFAIGTTPVSNTRCLAGTFLSREIGPGKDLQSLPVCEGVGLGFQGVNAKSDEGH